MGDDNTVGEPMNQQLIFFIYSKSTFVLITGTIKIQWFRRIPCSRGMICMEDNLSTIQQIINHIFYLK